MTDRGIRFLLAATVVAGLTSIVLATAPEAGEQASQQMYVVCYQFNGAPSTDYFSDPFPGTADDLARFVNGFDDYVAATYHVGKHIPTCVYYKDQAEAVAALKQRVSIAKNKVVETHWKPSDSPVPTPVQPQAKTAAPPGATPAAASAKQTLPMFCYATGSLSSGVAHTYVTKVFPGSPMAQPGAAFQAFLRNAHRDESIGVGTCSTALDADTLQGTRQEYIANQQKMRNRTVVEVDWKGGQ